MHGFWQGFGLGCLAVLVTALVAVSLAAGSPPGLTVSVGSPPPALVQREEAALLPSLLAAVTPAVTAEARREMAAAQVTVVVRSGGRRLAVGPARLRPLQRELSAWMVTELSRWLKSSTFRHDLLRAVVRDRAVSRGWQTLWNRPWHVRIGQVLSLWVTVHLSPQSSP